MDNKLPPEDLELVGYATIEFEGSQIVADLYSDCSIWHFRLNAEGEKFWFDTGIRYDRESDGTDDDFRVLEVCGI